ncbi:MAG: DUF1800 family protein, partial [Candidatus Limnocylindrus sp.]
MERPSPNQAITSKLSDDVRGFAESGSKNGAVQVNALLGENAGGSNYYDVLGAGAFGNFRTLLEQVTLSPMMGEYLSSLRNAKATFDTAGNAVTTPDENYAREVMQLFTIGLVRLQPDGTLMLGSDGLPIPTYNQTTITEMAKVFTGWAYPSTSSTAFRTAGANYISPMQQVPAFHDDTAKDLSPVLATPIPANQGGLGKIAERVPRQRGGVDGGDLGGGG